MSKKLLDHTIILLFSKKCNLRHATHFDQIDHRIINIHSFWKIFDVGRKYISSDFWKKINTTSATAVNLLVKL